MNSTLIIIRGIPGSGKSYLARKLQQSLGTENVVVLDPDSIDKGSEAFRTFSQRLKADGVDEKFHPFRFLRQTGYDGILAGKTVIWNQAFNDFNGFEITVARMKEFAKEHDVDLRVLVVEIEIDKETAATRIAARVAGGGHDVPREKLDKFAEEYESFAGRGYDTVTVNGAGGSEASVATITTALA